MNDKQQLMALGEEYQRQLLKDASDALKQCAVKIDGEWGDCRDWPQLVADKDGDTVLPLRIDALLARSDEDIFKPPHPDDFGIPEKHHEAAQYYAEWWHSIQSDDTTQQRNDLLDALENLVYYVADAHHPDPDDVYATIAHARATIERCRQ